MIETSISTLQLEEALVGILATEGRVEDITDELLPMSDVLYSNATVLLQLIREFGKSYPNKKFKIDYENRGEVGAFRVKVGDSEQIEELDESQDNPTVELMNVRVFIAPAMVNLLVNLSEFPQNKSVNSNEKIANNLRKLSKNDLLESNIAKIFLQMLNELYGY